MLSAGRLGLRVDPGDARGRKTVTVHLADRAGAPIEGAQVAVEAFHNARASRILSAALSPAGPEYAAVMPLDRPGLWEFRLRVTRGREVFVATLTHDVTESAMTALALTVLGASLLGSLHCAGMCGGFVAFYAGTGDGRAGLSHAAYNLGRLAAYAVLGAMAGALGLALDLASAPIGIPRAAAVLAGLLITLWGIAHASRGGRRAHGKSPSAVRAQRRRGARGGRGGPAAASHARARGRPAHRSPAVRLALRLRGDGRRHRAIPSAARD